jgi:hypothetical protein
MRTQEEIFNDIKRLAIRVDILKGFVQNDIQRMLDDGTITQEELKRAAEQCYDDFDEVMEDLRVNQLDACYIIESFIKE